MLATQNFNTKFLKKIKFLRLKIRCLQVNFKKKYGKKSLKKGVGSGVGSASIG
jgi:hypothetical protein